jgi:hypothetical protein
MHQTLPDSPSRLRLGDVVGVKAGRKVDHLRRLESIPPAGGAHRGDVRGVDSADREERYAGVVGSVTDQIEPDGRANTASAAWCGPARLRSSVLRR